MKTRISKHGKYEIREGVANEVGDSLEPGDILIVRADGRMIETRVVKRITNMGELEESCRGMNEALGALFRLMGLAYPGFFGMHPYLVRVGDGDDYLIWTAEESDVSPVKIKHPLCCDGSIVADKVEVGAIPADKVLVDGTASDRADVRIPRKPGVYVDNEGAVVRFFFIEGSDVLHYVYVVVDDAPGDAASAYPVTVDDCFIARYAPFTPVRSFKNIEVES